MFTRQLSSLINADTVKAILIVLLMLPYAAFAQDNPLDRGALYFLDILNGPFVRTLAVIAVMVVGIGWLAGRVDKRIAFTIIGGIILIFGAAFFVPEFIDAVQS